MPKFIDLIGATVGRWKVISRAPNAGLKTMWNCLCECGTAKIVESHSLRGKTSLSCGCLHRERVSQPKLQDSALGIWDLRGRLRWGAIRRGLEWSIPDELFRQLITSPCFYCGEPPNALLKIRRMVRRKMEWRETQKYHGIDRVDNRAGYTPENSVTCCWACNQMKSHYGVIEFIDRASKIVAGLRRFNNSSPAFVSVRDRGDGSQSHQGNLQ